MPANANYCITSLGSENIDFSAQSISIGSYITATSVVPPNPAIDIFYCFEIIGLDNPGLGYTATTSVYSSCYECLIDNYTIVTLSGCASSFLLQPQFDLSQFGFIPTLGDIYYLQITNVGSANEGTYTECFTVSSIEQLTETDYNSNITEYFTIDRIIFSNYSTCEECLNGFSAGTETNVCNICWDGSGYTVSVVSNIPHPTWTNAQGQAVVQLNAITLGGMNGLNA